jgi:RNA polymerase sigma-70 factor (ECF subfamily)
MSGRCEPLGTETCLTWPNWYDVGMAKPGSIPPADSNSSTATSRSLIDRVRTDDPTAWERLVSLYAPLVAYWCRRRGLSDADAADVFQEVFRSVAVHIGDFRSHRAGDTFRGWLRTIAGNKIHDFYRRRQHEPQAIGGSEAQQQFSQVIDARPDDAGSSSVATSAKRIAAEPQTPDAAIAGEAALERQLFLRGLELIRREFEPRTWQAFHATAVEGRAAKDVGAELSMSPGAVRVAKSRVLQRLREELGDVGE